MSKNNDSNHSVLIVDDDENILSSLSRLLRKEPYNIITVSCDAEAIGILNTQPIDLIVCDYTMPGPDDGELFQLIRKRWPDHTRILITGHYSDDALVQAVKDGEAYRYIRKPWIDDEVILTLRQALDKIDMQNEIRRLADEAERYRKLISKKGDSAAKIENRNADTE